MLNKPPISLQGGQGRKRSFTSMVNPSSSSTLESTTTSKTQKMDIDFSIRESKFPRDERSTGLTTRAGKSWYPFGRHVSKSFQKPTPRRNVHFTSLKKDKKHVGSYKQDAKFTATPKNCRTVVCPQAGAPQHKQVFINIESHKPFPRSDASMALREINC